MSGGEWVVLIIGVALLGYLVFAMLRPERF